MKTFAIVVGLVMDGGKVLMLKRSEHRKHAAGKWEPVSGFFQEHESAEAAVVREITEETTIRTEIIRPGSAFEVWDDGVNWMIKPFLLRKICDGLVEIDDEHDDFIWVAPSDVSRLDCVGGMTEDFEAVGLLEAVA